MNTDKTFGAQAWASKISEHELPALASTVKTMESLEEDKKASLAFLGRSVLCDPGLTSRILRVVNSVNYNHSRTQITTVSRAAVVLGFNKLKHICITARMIDSLLSNKNLSVDVYQRLLKLLAQSYHAAMLSKAILSEYSEDTREEVYIATLLHNLGEVAFWSMGGPLTEEVDLALRNCNDNAEQSAYLRDILGTDFSQLSLSLAGAWNMGQFLIKSLDQPDQRSAEMQSIQLSHQISHALVNNDKNQLLKLTKNVAEFRETNVKQASLLIQSSTKQSLSLLSSYGAKALIPYLAKHSGNVEDLADKSKAKENLEEQKGAQQALQLNMLSELMLLVTEGCEIHQLFYTVIEMIQRAVAMDRVLVFMLDQDKTKYCSRFIVEQSEQETPSKLEISLSQESSFRTCYQNKKEQWIDSAVARKTNQQLPQALDNRGYFIAPIVVNQNVIGAYYADCSQSERELTQADFDGFNLFIRQANLCLSVIIKK